MVLFFGLLRRVLALVCAGATIGLTAGLAPQTVARQHLERAQLQGPPTPTLTELAISEEVARQHSRTGPLGLTNGTEPPSGGLVHVVASGETLEAVALDYRVGQQDLLDFNGLRRAAQVKAGLPLRVPGDRPLSAARRAGGGSISYRASSDDHFPWGWCTWYVAQRRDVPWSGDARTWFASAQAAGWRTGQTPAPGAMMVTNESYWYGHVAYVERVDGDGSWVVSEMNYQMWGAVDLRTVLPGKVPLIGFIY